MDSIERYFIERIDTYLKVLTKFQMDEEKYGNTINIPACKSTYMMQKYISNYLINIR